MSEELKLKLSFDTSAAEEAAEALPDAIDRANRKARKFGDFAGGYTEIKGGALKSAGEKPAMERTAFEIKQEQERQKAAEQQAAAATKADEAANKWWDQGTARGRKQAEKDEREAERAANAERSRREKEQAQKNRDYLQRLKWNSKLQEDQDKAAANAVEWADKFGSAIEGTLFRALGPAALAAKAIEIGWGNVISMVSNIWSVQEAKLTAGVDPTQVRALQMFANVGTATNEQVTAMASRAQAVANANAVAGPGMNTVGFRYFGMTDYNRYREEGLPIGELLLSMTKKYKAEGGSGKYQVAAESILGSDWQQLRPLLAMAAKEKDPAKVFEDIESGGTMWVQYVQAKMKKMEAMGMSPGELMGGAGGRMTQMPGNVSSLQAMGGGDILSAIARGPTDQLVDNTARTAAAVEKMAGTTPTSTTNTTTIIKE